jgi:hypothetical protein
LLGIKLRKSALHFLSLPYTYPVSMKSIGRKLYEELKGKGLRGRKKERRKNINKFNVFGKDCQIQLSYTIVRAL